MSQSKPAAPGPTQVARLATTSVSLNLRGLVLLGTFGSQGSPRALVRLPDGSVHRVAPGDFVDGRNVEAISDGKVVFNAAGRSNTLVLPGERAPTGRSDPTGSR